MWGFRGLMNRKMADMMFVKMIDRDLSIKYNKIKNIKGHDQYFLGHHVYPLVKMNSTIHEIFKRWRYSFSMERNDQFIIGIGDGCFNRSAMGELAK